MSSRFQVDNILGQFISLSSDLFYKISSNWKYKPGGRQTKNVDGIDGL